MGETATLTIGEVARHAGIAASTIRYYELIGVLPAPVRIGGQRRYAADVLGKLGFVRVAQEAGFTLAEIRALISDIDGGPGLGPAFSELSKGKIVSIDRLLARTLAIRGWLQVAQTCGCASPDECALFPAPDATAVDPSRQLNLLEAEGAGCRRPQ